MVYDKRHTNIIDQETMRKNINSLWKIVANIQQFWLRFTQFEKHDRFIQLWLSERRKHALGEAKFFLALKSKIVLRYRAFQREKSSDVMDNILTNIFTANAKVD